MCGPLLVISSCTFSASLDTSITLIRQNYEDPAESMSKHRKSMQKVVKRSLRIGGFCTASRTAGRGTPRGGPGLRLYRKREQARGRRGVALCPAISHCICLLLSSQSVTKIGDWMIRRAKGSSCLLGRGDVRRQNGLPIMASGSIISKCWLHLTHTTEFLLCIAKTEPPHLPRSTVSAPANSRAPRTAFASLLHFPVLHQPRPPPTAPIAPNNMPASIPIPSTGPTPGTRRLRTTRSDRGLGQQQKSGTSEMANGAD
jgi:hypothetical protein